MQVRLLPDALVWLATRPVHLEAQDPGLSCRKRGFKSRTGQCVIRHVFLSVVSWTETSIRISGDFDVQT